MKGIVPPDPETNVSREQYAVIHTPRKNRKRFPAGCVIPCGDINAVISQSDVNNNKFPARVVGPSKSSEGQYIYYLIEWL